MAALLIEVSASLPVTDWNPVSSQNPAPHETNSAMTEDERVTL